MIQFEDLRRKANYVLNSNGTNTINLSNHRPEPFIEELLLHQVELELQNLNLLEIQSQLEESNKKYADLYDHAPIGYFTIDANGLISEVNATGAEMIGLAKQTIINKLFVRFLTPESQFVFSEYRQKIFKDIKLEPCELKVVKRNNQSLFVRLEGRMVNDLVTNNKNLLLMITDIQQQKEIENKLHLYQHKITANGQLSSRAESSSFVAHELNNPIGVIANYINGCIYRLEHGSLEKDQIVYAMKQASLQINRASEIILRMSNFVNKGDLDYQPTHVDSMIDETISLIAYEIDDFSATIEYRKNKHITTLSLDKLHIQQVILNLARNAFEAMRDAGTSDPKLMIEVLQPSKKTVEICVLDNGPGFPSDKYHKLFTPHFTTKPYGIGLGLSISRTIVEAHGGKLTGEANFPSGSCFKLALPIKC